MLKVKGDLCFTGKSQIANEILAYLSEHPDAQDTVEGIIKWWLLDRKINHQTLQVKEAVAELVAKGLIFEYKGGDSQNHYQINRHKHEEILLLLKQSDGELKSE